MTAGPSTTVVHVSSSCLVQARLTGGAGAFEITPDGYQVRSFLTQKVLHWPWSLTPLISGNLGLELDLQSMTRFGTDLEPGAVYDYPVAIAVNSVGPSGSHEIWSFLNSPFVLAVIGPVLAAVVALTFTPWGTRMREKYGKKSRKRKKTDRTASSRRDH
jgi:hypothetical protein